MHRKKKQKHPESSELLQATIFGLQRLLELLGRGVLGAWNGERNGMRHAEPEELSERMRYP